MAPLPAARSPRGDRNVHRAAMDGARRSLGIAISSRKIRCSCPPMPPGRYGPGAPPDRREHRRFVNPFCRPLSLSRDGAGPLRRSGLTMANDLPARLRRSSAARAGTWLIGRSAIFPWIERGPPEPTAIARRQSIHSIWISLGRGHHRPDTVALNHRDGRGSPSRS